MSEASSKQDDKKVVEKKGAEKPPVENKSKPDKTEKSEMGKHKKFDKFK